MKIHLVSVASFFKRYPALSTVRFYLLGVSFARTPSLIIPLLIAFFLVTEITFYGFKKNLRRISSYLFISLLGFYHLFYFQSLLPKMGQLLHGDGVFKIHQIKSISSFKKGFFFIQGTLETLEDSLSQKTYNNIPMTIQMKCFSEYSMDQTWILSNLQLSTNAHGKCFAKWNPSWFTRYGNKTFSLCEKRYDLKRKASQILRKNIHDFRTYKLLNALITGSLDYKTLQFEFSRLGLGHLVAISGLHFGILISIFSMGLQYFSSKKMLRLSLIFLITLYALFIGESPSVSRAYLGAILYLGAPLFGLKPSALNSLGIALWIAILCDPFVLFHMGFQLSFLATFGILLLYQPIEVSLQELLIPRSFSTVFMMPLFEKTLYVLGHYLRKSLALNLSVILVTLPALLFFFGEFSFLGFVYNLLVPFLFSFIMLLLVCGFLFLPIEPLSRGFFHLNEMFTKCLLKMISLPPVALDIRLCIPDISSQMALLITALILISGILFSGRTHQNTFSLRQPLRV